MKRTRVLFIYSIFFIILLGIVSGCANIIPPTGGDRDSLPPRLIAATPPDSARNVRPSRIVLTFDEYLNPLQDVQNNVIISPTLSNIPSIDSRLRIITIRFRDTLDPNTTYSINFGKSITDVNEGNVLQDFTYVFSTGNTIDANSFNGKAILAETGKVDSTLIVVLHRDLSDSAVVKLRPRYYAKVDGSGNFSFNNLPAGDFAVYALPNDYSKRYDDSTKPFAFLNKPVTISANSTPVTLYAYEQEKRKTTLQSSGTTPTGNRSTDKRLRYTNPEGSTKDILTPLRLEFVRKLKTIDSARIILSDTNYNRLSGYSIKMDSTASVLLVQYPWRFNNRYKLVIPKEAVSDTNGVTLTKSDTLSFTTKRAEEYGQVRLRFPKLDLSRNPVLQIVQNDVVIESVPLTTTEWKREFFRPGDYDLRILFDVNKNGLWDAGNFKKKIQPEIVQSLGVKLSVRANWENEMDISL